jgi:threonylcarbamoyladenosine tRNA methylthiotransferase MtaB
LVERGALELVLTGVNIGTYAYEEQTVLDVVDRLNEIDGLARIRISSIEPTTIEEGLFDRMNDPNHALVPYLHIPLQSGSDTVLKIMRRLYTRQEYINFIQLAYDMVPDICIGTDIMVGSPGETEADFEDSCALLLNGPLTYSHVFDGNEKNRRSAIIRRISGQKQREFQERFLGQTVEVLFESEEQGLWSGYTEHYIRVSVPSNQSLKNTLHRVHLEEIHGDFVMGSLIESTVLSS